MINIKHLTESGSHVFVTMNTTSKSIEFGYKNVLNEIVESETKVISGLSSPIDGAISNWSNKIWELEIENSVGQPETLEFILEEDIIVVNSTVTNSSGMEMTKWIPNNINSSENIIPTGHNLIQVDSPISTDESGQNPANVF